VLVLRKSEIRLRRQADRETVSSADPPDPPKNGLLVDRLSGKREEDHCSKRTAHQLLSSSSLTCLRHGCFASSRGLARAIEVAVCGSECSK
jgi:hypothetical protein